MKRTLLFLALMVIGFASCKKDDDTYSGPYTPPYSIDGIRDLILNKDPINGGFAVMDLYVNYENSVQEKITLSLNGVPRGMYASFTDSSAYPTFNSRLTLTDSNAVAGTYTLKLVATGNNSGRREFPFTLKVVPAPIANLILAANGYQSYTSCGGGSYTQNITAVAGTTDRVVFDNFDNAGNAVEAVVSGNAANGSVYIPTQTVNGVTYYSSSAGYYYTPGGSGTRRIQLDFYRSNGAGTTYCTLNMSL